MKSTKAVTVNTRITDRKSWPKLMQCFVDRRFNHRGHCDTSDGKHQWQYFEDRESAAKWCESKH